MFLRKFMFEFNDPMYFNVTFFFAQIEFWCKFIVKIRNLAFYRIFIYEKKEAWHFNKCLLMKNEI